MRARALLGCQLFGRRTLTASPDGRGVQRRCRAKCFSRGASEGYSADADPCEQLVEDLVMKVGEVGWILKSPPTWAVLVVRVGAGWSGRRLEDR